MQQKQDMSTKRGVRLCPLPSSQEGPFLETSVFDPGQHQKIRRKKFGIHWQKTMKK
jgi:hypothetical protein